MANMSRIFPLFLIVIFCLLSIGCLNAKKKKEISAAADEIIKTDEAFSAMSKEQGMKKAFIEYMDDEGILLRPGHPPIVGADAIDYLSQSNDTAFTLTWKPSAAEVSSSGDLGFTYGIYLLQLPDTSFAGTYVSIWKKQRDNKWKFILDTGNEGINNSPTSP